VGKVDGSVGGGGLMGFLFFVASRISAGTLMCLSEEGLYCMELII